MTERPEAACLGALLSPGQNVSVHASTVPVS
jgi:hypothetical protein